ncbi:MAG: chloride channel protein, partial [Pseudomonadota bacterium]
RSFFLTQLEAQGLHLATGPQGYLRTMMVVGDLMRRRGSADCAPDEECLALYEEGLWLRRRDTLERALPMLRDGHRPFLPVMRDPPDRDAGPQVIGVLYYTDALAAYSKLLEEELREEHS